MARITKVIGREILDSRGNPTVEADVILDDGSMRRSNCGTTIKNVISAREPARRHSTSIKRSQRRSRVWMPRVRRRSI